MSEPSRSEFTLRDVSVRLGGVVALADVDLEVARGEAVGLVGPSGSGKTTLLRLLNGSLRPTAGEVAVRGVPLTQLGPAELRSVRSSIGFVHQDFGLVPNLRVSQNVIAGRLGRMSYWGSLRAMLWPSRGDLEAVEAVLERVGIADKLLERTDRLSGGQRQRVALARALHQVPQAILADEPVSSVDPARARDTVELLLRVSRDEGLTLCASIHDLDLAREYLPRLVGLRSGRVVFDRPSREVSDEEFRALYDLRAEEMLLDGA